ncbi:hypothetical protein APHAL10511_005058 [Amanita phalloides]|nr:hypothetical protein APHAL10511_005058 [Amanita phalloides]
MTDTGASCHERLRAAARDDNEEMLLSAIEDEHCEINHADGWVFRRVLDTADDPLRKSRLGNTALHYATSHGSTNVLEHILCHVDCDVDPINAVEKATPLHLAAQLNDEELRCFIVNSLLDAGADITIRDKTGRTAREMIPPDDEETMSLFNRMEAMNSLDLDDIADDEKPTI